MQATILVMLGGAIGAAGRFHLGQWLARGTGAGGLPWGTLAVNLLGGLAMGLLTGWLLRSGAAGEPWRLLLGVGLLGGFTTFSAFSLDLLHMIERGQITLALGYALLSVVGALAALFAGLMLMRSAL
jgi:CrcB protein